MIEFLLVQQSHSILSNGFHSQQLVIREGAVHATVDDERVRIDSEVQKSHAAYVDIVGSEHD